MKVKISYTDAIGAMKTKNGTDKVLAKICDHRMNHGEAWEKKMCFNMMMTDRCSRCSLCKYAEEHKKDLPR